MSWNVTVYYNGSDSSYKRTGLSTKKDANDFVNQVTRQGFTYADGDDFMHIPKGGVDYCKIEEV